jgi:hypothetical protein
MKQRIITITAALAVFICCFGGRSSAQNWTVSCDLYDLKNTNPSCRLEGGTHSHTYDVLRRGLTSSRANGVDAVTVTYPQ